MATLEKIRNRAGLLVAIIIGAALFAFVLGDLFTPGQSMFTKSQHEIANIAGKSIPYTEYERRVNEFVEINKIMAGQQNLSQEQIDYVRNVTWDYMVQDYVMVKEFKKLGLAVSQEELFNMVYSENPDPLIVQVYANPETGVVNQSALIDHIRRVLKEENSPDKARWLFIEKELGRQRIMVKFTNLVKKGIFVTDVEAKDRIIETAKNVDIDYIFQPYTSVSDSAVNVTNADLKAYYKNNSYKYQQDETRDIKYLAFEVLPSQDDYKAAENWIKDIEAEFRNVEDAQQYVNLNSDRPYINRNYSRGMLTDSLDQFMFSAIIGDVYGPYFDQENINLGQDVKQIESYKLAKLSEINYLPDSVHARQIALPINQNNVQQMVQLADSLKELIENGADFAAIARVNSADATTARIGGDMGWFKEGFLGSSFSDSCFYGKTGDVKIVNTQNRGQYFINIVEIMEQSRPVKKVQVAFLVREIVASDVTDQAYYSKASEFAGLNNTYELFNKAIQEQNLVPRFAKGLHPMDQAISGLESPRPLIKWAFNADKHDVTDKVYKFGNKYVVAALEETREKGIAPFEDKVAEIEFAVLKQKKGKVIEEKINEITSEESDFESIANKLNTRVQSASGINFATRQLVGAGIEPKVVAVASTLEENVISSPIEGNNGVYLLIVTSVNEPAEPDEMNLSFNKSYISRNLSGRANYQVYDALKEAANIEDKRPKFY